MTTCEAITLVVEGVLALGMAIAVFVMVSKGRE